jgi:sec-independent protein translocase protein TatA
MGNIGASELVLIFLVALLVFGAKRLPDIARVLGQGIREFRKATREVANELQWEEDHRPRPIHPRAQHIAAPPPAPPMAPVREAERPADDHQPLLSVG